MYEQGIVLDVDLNRAKINLQNIKAQLDGFTTLYKQQINMLRYLLDLPAETKIEVEKMSDEVELSNFSEVSASLPELRLAAGHKELIERKIRTVKAGYIPKISLTAYAGASGYQEKFNHFFRSKESSQNWFGNCYIGLNITIPIFDANLKKLKIRQHRYDAEQAENNFRLLQDRLQQEYSNAVLQIDHNLEVYHAQSQSYHQALGVYNVTEEQYREGVSSMTALLQDEMQLRGAQGACVQAKCQYKLARLELLRLSGNLSLLTE